MRKNFNDARNLFPMPVLIISTYNEDGSVDCMNAAWGTMEDMDIILLELTKDHKTSENILRNKAFCVSVCDKANVIPGDYVGIVSGNKVNDKFAHTGWTVSKAVKVNAPVIDQLPVCLECELARIDETNGDFVVYGKIRNVSVMEELLDESGKLDLDKAELITYNSADHSYRVVSSKVGDAFKIGLKLK